jgi:hypothetical protein
MSEAELLDQMLEQALKLSPKAQLQLVEGIISALKRETEVSPPNDDEHWGKTLNRLLDSLDMSDWEADEFADPVEWLKQQRANELKARLGDWGADESIQITSSI